ncbi:MAG: thioredoxin family protein [Candidatus Competibacteraceae bacterium]|nr:thioredoxin family protein [Candidatus Competibacteraceae bacterium]
MNNRRFPLLLLAVVLVLTGAGLYRWRAAGSTFQAATDPMSSTVSGLPRLIELGSDSCASCTAMQQVLAELRAHHGGRLEVVAINLLQYPEQTQVWQVKFIPTQIFLDGQGRELFRHVGYLPRQAVEERFAALGSSTNLELALFYNIFNELFLQPHLSWRVWAGSLAL